MSLIPRNSLFDFDHFFDRFWSGNTTPSVETAASTFAPRVDVHEKDNHFEITAELPGVEKEDIHVSFDDGVLTLAAETHQENKEEKEGKVIRQERRYGKFMRSFNLGAGIKESDIQASFKNGVLTLTTPKPVVAESSSRRIEIK